MIIDCHGRHTTKRYIDNLSICDADKADVFANNVRRVHPRLDTFLKSREVA